MCLPWQFSGLGSLGLVWPSVNTCLLGSLDPIWPPVKSESFSGVPRTSLTSGRAVGTVLPNDVDCV